LTLIYNIQLYMNNIYVVDAIVFPHAVKDSFTVVYSRIRKHEQLLHSMY